MRIILLSLALLFSVLGQAQKEKVYSPNFPKIDFILKAAIDKYQAENTALALFVRGDIDKIKKEVHRLGGKTGVSIKNLIQVKLPANTIVYFSNNSFVDQIEYSSGKGVLLNDTMTVHNNITPVHNGQTPLTQPYTGKGVVLGFIDTGIDIFHPDFQDSLGNTRILRIWDQTLTNNGTSTYGYGQVWDSASINNSTCTHVDHSGTGHGTHVAGVAAGNGLAVNNYKGVAPEADIIMVASNFSSPSWLSEIVDAVEYIYAVADSLGKPCVINASLGTYLGSHDGTDGAAVAIDALVNDSAGRAFVCSAGNAGTQAPYHLRHHVTSDTTFTWFKYNPATFGYGAVFYEIWADTADLNNVQFAVGANLPLGNFDFRGRTPFDNIKNRLGLVTDTIKSGADNIAIVDTYGQLQGDKYLLQIHLKQPDSSSYYFSLMTTGSGKLDTWSAAWLGTSDIVASPLPTVGQLPEIVDYQKPDTMQSIVSSFSCLPSVLTVANFSNRSAYLDVDSIVRSTGETPGKRGPTSSIGPDRRGNIKPDIAATGNSTLGPNPASVIAAAMGGGAANREKVAYGAMHRLNGGTSMASPVVAGVAALYLEQNPTATMAEIKNAITSTAKQDTYTGVTPNPGFGYGKVNGFEALKSYITMGVPTIQGEVGVLKVYPNPSTGEITIDLNDQMVGQTLFITDMSGKIVKEETISIGTKKLQLNLKPLSEGIYLLNIKSEQGSYLQKVILTR